MEVKETPEWGIVDEGMAPVEEARLYYCLVGSGLPVIIVHGGPGIGHAYLRPGMDLLADDYQLVFYDQRGSGRSEIGDADHVSLTGGGEDLAALLGALGIQRANLLGHSFGADLAAVFAARYPDRVASLILANPGPPFDPDMAQLLWSEMEHRTTSEEGVALEHIKTSPDFASRQPSAVEAYVQRLYLPFFNDRTVGLRQSYGFTQITAENFPEASQRTFRDLDPRAVLASLSAISAPTLVVHAEMDPIPEAFSRTLADQIPDAQYAFLPKANHFAYLETPELFFAPVRGFLDEFAS